MRTALEVEWNTAHEWTPEVRYQQIGTATDDELAAMIESTRELLRAL